MKPSFYACSICNATSDDPAECPEHPGQAMEPVVMGDVNNPGAVPEGNLTFELGLTDQPD